jgi:VWFA-related protein
MFRNDYASRRRSIIFMYAVFSASICAYGQNPLPKPTALPRENDVVKISTNLIQLDVTVVDAKGKVVRDLLPEEIEVYENGEKQKITNFSFVSTTRTFEQKPSDGAKKDPDPGVPLPSITLRPEQIRRTIALVVDDLSLSFESAYYTRRALKKYVDEQMQDGDLVAIIRTGAGIGALQQFTSDKSMLYAAIERVKWNPSGNGKLSAFAPMEPTFADRVTASGGELKPDEPGSLAAGDAAWEDFQTSTYSTGTLGALRYIVEGMSELPGRKSVILFSEGWTIFERDEHGFSKSGNVLSFLRRLVEDANRSSVVFYTIDARGLVDTSISAMDKLTTPDANGGTPLPDPRVISAAISERNNQVFSTQAGMAFLAKETGGFSVVNNNDLSGGVRRVLDDQSYYLVAYEPDSDTFDPENRKFNKIEIRVLRKGATARYRSGFFNVADRTTLASNNVPLPPIYQLRKALTSPFAVNGISLRMNALFSSGRSGAFVRSLLHIPARDLKFTDEPDGSKTISFDVWAASFGDNGSVVDQITKTYNVSIRPEGYKKVLEEGILYHFTFPVKKPGGYQYRVAIRDTQGGKIGSASQFIQVPDLKKGRLTTSSIVIENMPPKVWEKLMDPNGGAVRSTSTVDTALRQVKLGSILRYGFEIYNAKLGTDRKPDLQTQIRVFLDGKIILSGVPVPVELTGQTDMQRIAVSGAISFGDKMLPGDYVLQVIVTDKLAKAKNAMTTRHVQFEAVP